MADAITPKLPLERIADAPSWPIMTAQHWGNSAAPPPVILKKIVHTKLWECPGSKIELGAVLQIHESAPVPLGFELLDDFTKRWEGWDLIEVIKLIDRYHYNRIEPSTNGHYIVWSNQCDREMLETDIMQPLFDKVKAERAFDVFNGFCDTHNLYAGNDREQKLIRLAIRYGRDFQKRLDGLAR